MEEELYEMIKSQLMVKDEQISRLHDELAVYKQLVEDKYTDELMKELIRVRKSMKRVLEADDWNEKTSDELRREYRYTYEDVTDLLEQNNVDEIRSQPGDDFDAAFMSAKVEKTSDPAQDRKVAESLQTGYKKGDKVLIPEKVRVYKYTEE